MIFRQLFDLETSTYSYLLADSETHEAVLIDPVLERFERDTALVRELDLVLRYTLETHVHADHVTAAARMREALGSKVAVGAAAGVHDADLALQDGDTVRFGREALEVRATPGHTNGCVTYVHHAASMAFTGDALLVRGCGRTDFQEGDARMLFRSVRERIFSLPDATLLYPAHDYAGRTVTTVGEEKRFSPRLASSISEPQFVALMAALKLAYPKRIDVAVPANLQCGLVSPEAIAMERRDAPQSVAALVQRQGRQDADMTSGLGI
jgi:glyoxylase-like metal-dependent hydrolase (beta-lactamase superfamily II)